MANYNRVILMGNLTRDPELKYLPSGTAVCEFGMAINHRWRDKDGNQREDVCFVDISAFGRQGETINQYMSKGRQLLVEGRLRYDSWTAQDGSKRSRLSVVAENFQFVGSRGEAGESRADSGASRGAPAQAAAPPAATYSDGPQVDNSPSYSSAPEPGGPPAGDDIPF